MGLTDPVINPAEPPKKIGRFGLSEDSSNTWEIYLDLVDHANKDTETFASYQTLIEGILSANPIPSNIKRIFLLDLYFRPLLEEHGKQFLLN